ncbi:MAG: hypothetical protein M3452_08330, partial [Chloroflexota bacterium]|nr:hypothetical protein [Chloroflexota bacterium]
ELGPVIAAPGWSADAGRRAEPASAGRSHPHAPASTLESLLVSALRGESEVGAEGLRLSTSDRSFGAALSGALERGELRGPIRLELRGSAGQSFGAFASAGLELRLVGQANDYVGKGLSGGSITVVPEPDLGVQAATEAIAGNTVLYGATEGRLHLVGRAGMRFAVRNSGAEAVVEGIGPHGCEYMTGGTVVVLGPIGANLGAGMTGGRTYLYDPAGHHIGALDARSVGAVRLSAVAAERADGPARVEEVARLLSDHRAAGSAQASRLLAGASPGLLPIALLTDLWVVEPVGQAATATATVTAGDHRAQAVPERADVRTRPPAAGTLPTFQG